MAVWLRHGLIGALVFTLALALSLAFQLRDQREEIETISGRQRDFITMLTASQERIEARELEILNRLEQCEGANGGGQ